MVKQTVSLKVLPEDATNKELKCTLSDKSLATIKPVTGGVELDARKGGTGTLTVESHHGEVTKTVPVNVGETNDILIDGTNGTGSRYVKDICVSENLLGSLKHASFKFDPASGHIKGLSYVDGMTLSEITLPAGKYSLSFVNYQKLDSPTSITLYLDNYESVPTSLINFNTYALGEITKKTFTLSKNTVIKYRMWGNSLGQPTEFTIKLEKGEYTKYSPAPEWMGIVHGQPNLLNGTSSTLSEVTFIQTQYKETNLVVSNLFKPNDLVTYAVQIDNTAGTADVFAQLTFKKSDNTYVSFNGSSVLKGSIGRSMVQVTVLEEYTNIYVKPLVKSNSTISTTVRYGEEKLIKGSLEAMDEWTPSQSDFEGKPNLLDGTSDQWVEETFSSYDSSIFPVVPLSTSGLKIGDTLSLSVEIDNTKSIFKSRSFISYYNSSGSRLVTNSTGLIDEGTVGVATVTSVIPEGAVSVIVSRVSKHSTGTSTVSTRKHKLIKGTVAELGIWVPKDRTEYDKNLGIVPFTEADYNTLQTADEIVRAETKVVGRGAEIEFKFDVIGTLEKKYPYLFEGITTMDEKIEKYKSKLKQFRITHTSRGGGISTTTGNVVNRSRMRIKTGSITWGGIGDANITDRFISVTTPWIEPYRNIMNDDGTITTAVVSKNNNVVEAGVVSDGVTPAWVEVKDIRLEVTIQLPEDPNAQPITITIPPS